MTTQNIDLATIKQAAARIAPHIHLTPVMSSALIDKELGCRLVFKCENLQRAGAFKARGAHNAVLSLTPEQRANGVATHSSGNHAAALALAARSVEVPAYIVMPDNAPAVKVEAVRAYGGEVSFCESTQSARESALREVCETTGAFFVPPFAHADVIAGQGTCALELTRQLTQAPDMVMAPIGGGGLLAGTAISCRSLWPGTRVIGAEPAGADDAQRGFRAGRRVINAVPDTIADGLRTTVGEQNFDIILQQVDDILTASDDAIVRAMRLVLTRMKLLIEPSAAVPLAVVMEHASAFRGKSVAIILSGGNVDIDQLHRLSAA